MSTLLSEQHNETVPHFTIAIQPLIRPDVLRNFQLICYGIISEAIAVFGIGTNIINIICFVKQGFKESINISLLSLAISDLGSLITLLWMNVCLVPDFQEADVPFHVMDTQYLVSGMPHVTFSRVTGVITAFITLERCLCITMPLKISSIFRPKRVAVINAGIFIFLIISASPIYISSYFAMRYYPELNKTVLGVVFTEQRVMAEQVSLAINSVLVPFSALLITIVCMVTMVITLQKQAKWRSTQRVVNKLDSSSEREQRLVKMIVMISTLFVACFCPSAVLFMGVASEPEFSYGGKYFDVTLVVFGISNIAESTNSSMNIFIYHKMSTRYRTGFRNMFCIKSIDTNQTKKDSSQIKS